MRHATVNADGLNVHKSPGSKEIIAILTKGDRVEITGPCVQRDLKWWPVRFCPPGRPAVDGWAAQGKAGLTWLKLDPVPKADPPDDPVEYPDRGPQLVPMPASWWDEHSGWLLPAGAVVAVILAILFWR